VLALAAFTAAQTASLHFDAYEVPEERCVAIAPSNWVHAKDRLSVAAQGMFALGCAQAALDLLVDNQAYPTLLAAHSRAQIALLGRVNDGEHYAEALAARAEAIALMARCAHAAVVASAGSANLATHAAQRCWREALVFTVLGQSADVRAATLDALAQVSGSHRGE
jgi:hypothetical protein